MALYFITGNSGKFAEAEAILSDVEQLNLELPEIQSLDSREIIEAKLAAARERHDGAFIVEDTSLACEGLGGLPGPLIKWFLRALSLEQIAQLVVASGNARAEAKVTIGYVDKEGRESFFEGVQRGNITAPRGEGGFGWDPIFQPDGYAQTFGEMGREQKNEISMRRKALEQLRGYLDRM